MAFGFDQMRYGLCVWAIEPSLNAQNIDQTFNDISQIFSGSGILQKTNGKPVVEVFASPNEVDLKFADNISEKADEYGLDVICCGFNPKGNPHLVDSDASKREAAVQRVKGFIDFTVEATSGNPGILTGPFYTEHTRNIGRAFRQIEWIYLIEGLKQIADYAMQKDVYLAMELLNRKETNMLNTVESGWQAVRKVRQKTHCKYLGLHLDTIHQYREEGRTHFGDRSRGHLDAIIPSFRYALKKGVFYHLHLSENPRLQWGTGNIGPLTPEIISTLQKHDYKGAVVVECFHPSLDGLVGIKNRPAEQQNPIKVATNSLAYIAQNMPE